MTSKNSFWKISLLDFKRRAGMTIICFISCFILITLSIGIHAYNNAKMLLGHEIVEIDKLFMRSNFSIDNLYFIILALSMALIFGITGNMWMNSQNQNDFYRSLPIKNSTRFVFIHLNSIISFEICFIVNIILANVLVAMTGLWDVSFITISLMTVLMNTLLFISAYFVVVIAVLLTGNNLMAIVGAGFLMCVEPWFKILLDFFTQTFVKTLYSGGYYDSMEEMLKKSLTTPLVMVPIAYEGHRIVGVDDLNSIKYWDGNLQKIAIILLVQAIVYMIIAFAINRNRPASNGQKQFIFVRTIPYIKCIIFILAGLSGVISFIEMMDNSFGLAIIGVFVIIILMHIIFQFVVEGQFIGAIKKGINTSLISLLVIVVISIAFKYGGRAYDTTIPDIAKVESISVVGEGGYYYDLYDTSEYESYTDYLLDTLKIKDQKIIELVYDNINATIENGTYSKDEDWKHDDNYLETYSLINVAFNLENGKCMKRSFSVPITSETTMYHMIVGTHEFAAITNPLDYSANKEFIEHANRIELEYWSKGHNNSKIIDKKYNQAMLDALSDAYLNRTTEEYKTKNILGSITIQAYKSGFGDISLNYHVYESDKEVIDLLNEMNVDLGIYDKDAIICIKVDVDNYTYSDDYVADELFKEKQYYPGDEMYDYLVDKLAYSMSWEDIVKRTEMDNDYDYENQGISIYVDCENDKDILCVITPEIDKDKVLEIFD